METEYAILITVIRKDTPIPLPLFDGGEYIPGLKNEKAAKKLLEEKQDAHVCDGEKFRKLNAEIHYHIFKVERTHILSERKEF